ncbi:malonate--CoA ligase ACSF3, mitochondrial-like [Ptychodera flava]|uniref:malonate--CoA ligase ACSF3, mitochondrial-like n=1 Tax=Ptychodera flava TaxID=63121 RepID=UPI00396A0CC0
MDTDKPLISLMNAAYQNSWKKTNWANHDAMLIYTSGTTSKPKGVAVTHANLHAQVENMVDAWEWTDDDIILHTLPLHHVHGITNCLATPLYCGATCVMMPKFDARKVWTRLLSDQNPRINIFMAVPTIYAKLIEYYNQTYQSPKVRDFIRGFCKENIRLMVSGSAALPAPVMAKWEEITGHVLLERYGMTEIGMALTNSLHGPRIPGAVGNPFPSVELQIVDGDGRVLATGSGANGTAVTQGMEEKAGELYVRGPSVFTKYWRRPTITVKSFTTDGWFKTGDTAVYQDGVYRILGRDIDIIKSGGYKISALEIERHLLANEKIKECVAFGLPDSMWGERVAVVAVLHEGESLTLMELKTWAADKLAHYKIPSVLECVDEIPKNAMGKVNKKEVRTLLFPEENQNTPL